MRACSNFSVRDFLFCSLYSFASLYLFIFLSMISSPLSVLAASIASTIHCCFRTEVGFALNVEELQSPLQNFIKLNSFFLVLICFLSTWVLETLWENVNQLLHCYAYRKRLQTKLYSIVYFLLLADTWNCYILGNHSRSVAFFYLLVILSQILGLNMTAVSFHFISFHFISFHFIYFRRVALR